LAALQTPHGRQEALAFFTSVSPWVHDGRATDATCPPIIVLIWAQVMPVLLESIRGRDGGFRTALRCMETLVDSDRGARMVATELQGDLAVLGALAPLLEGESPEPSACRILQSLLMRYEDCRVDLPAEIIATVDAFSRAADAAAETVDRETSVNAGVSALATVAEPSASSSGDVHDVLDDPSHSPDPRTRAESRTESFESRSFDSSVGGVAEFTADCCIVTVFLPGGARSQVCAHGQIAQASSARRVHKWRVPSTTAPETPAAHIRMSCPSQIEIGRDTTIGTLKKRAMLDAGGTCDSLDASEYALRLLRPFAANVPLHASESACHRGWQLRAEGGAGSGFK
jgi:hypothetical protein